MLSNRTTSLFALLLTTASRLPAQGLRLPSTPSKEYVQSNLTFAVRGVHDEQVL